MTAITIPATLPDTKSGRDYVPCGEHIADSFCARYTGHKGEHRLTLYAPADPERVAQRDAWKAMTEEQKQAEYARRKAVSDERKAAAKAAAAQAPAEAMPSLAASGAVPARKPQRRAASKATAAKRTTTKARANA